MTFVPKLCAEKIMATSGDISDFPIIVVLVAIVEENHSLTVETVLHPW